VCYKEDSNEGVLSEVLSEMLKNEKDEKRSRKKCPFEGLLLFTELPRETV
jgi:hypothetical protein